VCIFEKKKLQLNLPKIEFKIVDKSGVNYIFDPWQKKYLQLKPEELVRVCLLDFLITQKGFSPNLSSIEKGIKVNNKKKRIDALFYNKEAKPILLIECKAPYVEIDEQVLHQALSYNLEIKAKFILLSNGINHLFIKAIDQSMWWSHYQDFPSFKTLDEAL